MPYVDQDTRERLSVALPTAYKDMKPGEINYLISFLCSDYLNENGVSYTNINTLIGALECAKLELYRRIAVPYEDVKIKENGDVYG